jgi:hypothetical protein
VEVIEVTGVLEVEGVLTIAKRLLSAVGVLSKVTTRVVAADVFLPTFSCTLTIAI